MAMLPHTKIMPRKIIRFRKIRGPEAELAPTVVTSSSSHSVAGRRRSCMRLR
jgi:hypothetical protein